MIGLALAAFLGSAASPWQLAYVARVYYPPGDRRTSRHQVYLSDLHGGHRRQVTTGAVACRSVRWLDRKTIAWTREDGTLWRMRVDGGKPQLWLKRKVLFLEGVSLGEELRVPGQPVFGLDRPYRYTGGKLVPFTSKPGWWCGAAEGCDIRYLPGTADEDPERSAPESEYHGGLFVPESGLRLNPRTNGPGNPVTAWSGPGKNDLWALFGSSLSTWGEYHDLIRYDRATGRIRWHRSDISDLDFRPDRAMYARVSHRDLSPYGKRQVWTAPIHVGDWKSSQEWQLTRGTTEALSVSLRP